MLEMRWLSWGAFVLGPACGGCEGMGTDDGGVNRPVGPMMNAGGVGTGGAADAAGGATDATGGAAGAAGGVSDNAAGMPGKGGSHATVDGGAPDGFRIRDADMPPPSSGSPDAADPDSAVATPGWGPAEKVGDTLLPFAVSAAINVRGDAVVTWQQVEVEPSAVQASYFDARAETWTPAQLIERTDRTMNAVSPQVGIDPEGNAIVLWQRESPDLVTGMIWGNRYDAAAKAWGEAAQVSTRVGARPVVLMAPDGDATGMWGTLEGLSIGLAFSRYDAGAARWNAEQPFDQATGIAAVAFPVVASAPGGAAVAVYTQGDLLSGTVTVHARRTDAESTEWNAPELVARDATPVGNTTLIATGVAVNDAGTSFVVWQDEEGEQVSTAWVSRYDERRGVWSEAERLGREEKELALLPQVAVDAAGNAIAVWSAYTEASNRQQIWANRYHATEGRWVGAQPLGDDVEADAIGAQIGMDERGNAIVTWLRRDDESQTIWARRYDATSESWDTAVSLDVGGATDVAEPKLVTTSTGEALVAWMNWDGGVYANRYRPLQ